MYRIIWITGLGCDSLKPQRALTQFSGFCDAAHGLELVSVPTYDPRQRWIDVEFAAIRYVGLKVRLRRHGEQGRATRV